MVFKVIMLSLLLAFLGCSSHSPRIDGEAGSNSATVTDKGENIEEYNDGIEITSEPTGCRIEILEDEDINERGKTGNKYKKTGKQYITPCNVKLELNKTLRYFIKFEKEGFIAEIAEVQMRKQPFREDALGKQKAGKVFSALGGFIPVMIIPGLMLRNASNLVYVVRYSPYPLHVILKPTKYP